MSMSMVVIAVVAVVVVLAVWYSMNSGGTMIGANAHQRITPQEYQAGYAKRGHLLVDVRTAEEFRSGHIPGAINIALQDLPQRMDTLPKDQPIVLYCRSGARSNNAAQMLAKAGFENVHDLGGIMRWQAQGLPVQ
jgi:rhodanese-related sulfurtransferase